MRGTVTCERLGSRDATVSCATFRRVSLCEVHPEPVPGVSNRRRPKFSALDPCGTKKRACLFAGTVLRGIPSRMAHRRPHTTIASARPPASPRRLPPITTDATAWPMASPSSSRSKSPMRAGSDALNALGSNIVRGARKQLYRPSLIHRFLMPKFEARRSQ